MRYRTYIRKRKSRGRQEWLARLIWEDVATQESGEMCRSAESRSEAQRKLKSLENQFLAGGKAVVQAQGMTIGELLEHCLKTRYYEPIYDGQGRKKGGVRSYKTVECHIKTIAAFFGSVKQGEGEDEKYAGGIKVCEIKVASLRAFRKELLKDREIPTANRILSTFRAILNEAMVNDWIVVNPFAKARKGELITTADERERETILTSAEEQRLLEACSIDSRRHLKALVVAALDTGARQGELFRLRWSDVDFQEAVIHNLISYKGPTVQRRDAPMSKRLRELLIDLKANRPKRWAFRVRRKNGLKPDDELVFGVTTNVKDSWEAARKDADLEHVRFHDLRHTAATRLARRMELVFVGHVLGHSDPKTTRRYVNKTRQMIVEAATIMDEWHQTESLQANGGSTGELVH